MTKKQFRRAIASAHVGLTLRRAARLLHATLRLITTMALAQAVRAGARGCSDPGAATVGVR